MTAQRYVHGILQSHVLPFRHRIPGAIFQQDNPWPHMARVSQDFFRTVTTLPWPTRSPDLSPIQHIWDHSGWRVGHPTYDRHLKSETPCDLPQNWDGIEPNRPVTCMVLKATANDRRKCSRLLR
ncbi:transposable element Tcb2 transposase [Trichonephila clavipes]|nr:transposable element Tcb2 transposase [Trichonephila clavipes]